MRRPEKTAYRRELVRGQSARLLCGYIYASAGDGESTQDVVYSGHNLIAENGRIVSGSRERFDARDVYPPRSMCPVLRAERRRMTTFETVTEPVYRENLFSLTDGRDKADTVILIRCRLCRPESADRTAALRGDLIDPGDGTEKTSGAYTLQVCRDRYFRRTGFHAGTACDRACF